MFDTDPFYTVVLPVQFGLTNLVEPGQRCCLKEQAFRPNLRSLVLVFLTVAGAEADEEPVRRPTASLVISIGSSSEAR
jgi:hypothetical protein